ncbi:lipopolysaccharide biosynthesis protein [Rothia sp. P7181]|uniref:lipopolysaccharide biosynthesis protein n=1 Tax=Rothia sp. P7181 TaxID=3402663 RepID=UPI003AE09EBA
MASLSQLAGRGALLGSAGQFGKLAINLASLVILARMLSPHDYGLLAMVTAVIGVAELIRDMGLSTAALQAKTLSFEERNNLWWANTGLGVLCSIGAASLAPLLAWVYNEPDVLTITLCLSLVFTISGAATQYRTDLTRNLQMGKIAAIDLLSGLCSLIGAIYIAHIGGGYWALVFQQVSTNLLALLCLSYAAKWLPRFYDRTVSIQHFFKFGFPIFGSSLLTYWASNLDTTLVGKFFGTVSLGYYNRGMQVIRLPMNQIRNPLTSVAISTLSKVQDDEERFNNYVTKAQVAFLYPITLISLWIAATAQDTIPLLLGVEWSQVIPLVIIFAVGDAISNLSSAGGWVYLSKGKSYALLQYTVISTVTRIVLFCIMVPFGLYAIASVYAIAPTFLWPLSLYICYRATGYSTKRLFFTSLRIIISCGIALLTTLYVGYYVIPGSGIIHLMITSFVYLSAFSIVILLVPIMRQDFLNAINTLRNSIKSN